MARLNGSGIVLPDNLGWDQTLNRIGEPGYLGLLREPEADATFVNPIYPGADPWVVQKDGWYYLCQAGYGGRLEVWNANAARRAEDRLEPAGERLEPGAGVGAGTAFRPRQVVHLLCRLRRAQRGAPDGRAGGRHRRPAGAVRGSRRALHGG